MFRGIIIRKNLLVLVIIISLASSLSIVSTQYSIQTSNEIRNIASDDIAANAQNEAFDLSRIVVNKIDSVTTNLQVLANGPSIQSGRAQEIAQLFDAAQYSTEELTEYYMWLDSEGTIISASNIARASYQYNSMWKSEKPPFLTEPQKTASIYYSKILKSSVDNTERLYIAYPIIYSLQQDENLIGDFRGVIVASIRLDTLGAILTSELSPTFESDVSLVDISGEMIYSVERSVIGKNIFENPTYLTTPIFRELTEDAGAKITDFLRASDSRQQAELNISIEGKSFTIASHPITQNGNHFWTLYIIAPHVFTDNVDALLAKQYTFTMMTLLVIGAVSVGMAYLVLSCLGNRKLEDKVKARTQDLRTANTSLTELNAQLASANEKLELHGKLQREFIDVAAHELRTPIMPILGMTDLIESKFQQSKNGEIILRKDDFEIISRNARRLERLATDILDVTKIETQSLHLNKQQFDLYDIVDLAVNDIKIQFPNDKITYVIQLDKGTNIFADKAKLSQVLGNLLSNAVRFTDEGSITVTGVLQSDGSKGELVHISVSDTGTGIDSEVMPKLFTKFTNKAGIDRAQVGSGLGLFISKGIIDAHAGKIWAENNHDGRGTTIHLTFPTNTSDLLQAT